MKTTCKYYYSFFVLFLLPVFMATVLEARDPFNAMEPRNSRTVVGGLEGFFDGLYLGAIKQSGPSPGAGHKFTEHQTLGGIKDAGPSPGQGHSHVNGAHH
ncbi:hypothetical protein I3843_01G012500 [Carya illinoinensis]|uniref:Transmembrane protein n=1 Tax=Carya illinoinensis TaxID=32201 RepID=A0A8T1RGU7_CARIL|nr:hypothetical protein CIPAW_01G012500 [Carya illinoinensis]KAG6729131.1 hypothetical protein I3842_01G011500 [Carya illinoinensis]KAG7993594.1 hypothetical protein I3843_01G012500 [Carya illinoinensis]